jgi:flagellar assembly factor FliW
MTRRGEQMSEQDVPVIEFVAPMPGFPDRRRFLLVRLDEDASVYTLTSVDDPELRFLVVPPMPFFPDYAPELDPETLELLGVKEAEALLVLLVVTTGSTAADATANLLAPIVIEPEERRAVQAVLTGSGLPVSTRLLVTA